MLIPTMETVVFVGKITMGTWFDSSRVDPRPFVTVSLLTVLLIGGCVTTTSDVPGQLVVRDVISALIQQFPASTHAVARYFKNGESGRLKKIVKTDDGQRIIDYEWTSADGDYFMTDQKVHEFITPGRNARSSRPPKLIKF